MLKFFTERGKIAPPFHQMKTPLMSTAIDKKFKILAVNEITGSVHTEETALLLCAKDKAAPAALDAYLAKCIELGAGEDQINSVKALIQRVKDYQEKHNTKVADVTTEEAKVLLS